MLTRAAQGLRRPGLAGEVAGSRGLAGELAGSQGLAADVAGGAGLAGTDHGHGPRQSIAAGKCRNSRYPCAKVR